MEKTWYRDEFNHTGADFTSPEAVRNYDLRMGKIRDADREAAMARIALGLTNKDTLADIGSGTGAYTLRLAPHCAKVYAVDISRGMLEYTSERAEELGLDNIEFHQGGFLSWKPPAERVNKAVSSMALHHLPDFWKLIALQRVRSWLAPGGVFYLRDIAYSFSPEDYSEALDLWVQSVAAAGDQMRTNVENHIRNEFSTTACLLEHMLDEAGFDVVESDTSDPFLASFVCRSTKTL
jgi:ubiquinone/menaquinone biosynthesis C-methylase UbiE